MNEDQKLQTPEMYDDDTVELMVLAAIEGDSGFPLDIEIGDEPNKTLVRVIVRWPNWEDEKAITIRTATILDLPPDLVTTADYHFARGSAIIERLAVEPYPNALQRVLDRNGKIDVKRLKSRVLAAMVNIKFTELQGRFRHLAI